jgi:hypothetical protein
LKFPERIYTAEELKKAAELVEEGHKHRLKLDGSRTFTKKAEEALKLIKTAGYHDFLRTYIRRIVEIDGITQLREADATIWVNEYILQNPVDAASLFIQKANKMKEYLEGKFYSSGMAEERSVEKRVEFLRALKKKSQRQEVLKECEKLLRGWTETVFL